MKTKVLIIVSLFFIINSCSKNEGNVDPFGFSEEEYAVISNKLTLPQKHLDYTLVLPNILKGNTFLSEPNNALATLGRVLFYDKKLSSDNSTSCASCHEAEKAFSDGKDFSDGVGAQKTSRNSIALGAVVNFESSYGTNSSSNHRPGFFWDDRALTIEAQSGETIENPIELGVSLVDLDDKLLQEDYYQILFEKAFADQHEDAPKSQLILSAISAFVNSIASFDSKFDRGLANHDVTEAFSNFENEENWGKTLFLQNCATCHGPFSSTPIVFLANNGLDLEYADKGRGEVSNYENDYGKFKVPLLRNIALTAPYMHDGRFTTLEEVLDHYSTGVKDHPNLHQNLRNEDGSPRNLNLSEEEKIHLMRFLNTLTDVNSLLQEKYSDPFK